MEFQHLKIVRESYGKHLLFTVKLSAMLLLLAGCSVVHGIFPFLLTGTVSDKIKHLNTVLSEASNTIQIQGLLYKSRTTIQILELLYK